jgi:anti-anti-sigma factor
MCVSTHRIGQALSSVMTTIPRSGCNTCERVPAASGVAVRRLEPTGACRFGVERGPAALHVHVTGELDRFRARALTDAVAMHVLAGEAIELDLGAVTFIDGAAYRAIVELLEHHDGPAHVSASSAALQRMASLLGELLPLPIRQPEEV